MIEIGDYVLATKWFDGSPCDLFCVGFVTGTMELPRHGKTLYNVEFFHEPWGDTIVRSFGRVQEITEEEGRELLDIFPSILDYPGPSLWSHLKKIRANNAAKTFNQ
jgi:hypothetical protein